MGNLGNLGKNWENSGISGVTKNIKIFSGVTGRSGAERGVANSGAERGGCLDEHAELLHNESVVKLLGVLIDEELKFEDHIKMI